MRLLFVCTGNVCRSPVAERLAADWFRQHAGDHIDTVRVTSAGLAAEEGEQIHPLSAAALERLGGNHDGFRSRTFTAEMATDADLVLTMTRPQRRSVLEQTPRGLRRTFTLAEAAGLLAHADVAGLGELPIHERARTLAQRLDAARMHRASTSTDDIEDPIGRRAGAHRDAAGKISEALQSLLSVLVPPRLPREAPHPSAATCAADLVARPA